MVFSVLFARIKPNILSTERIRKRGSLTAEQEALALSTVEIVKIPPGSCVIGNFKATASQFHKRSQLLPKPRHTQH